MTGNAEESNKLFRSSIASNASTLKEGRKSGRSGKLDSNLKMKRGMSTELVGFLTFNEEGVSSAEQIALAPAGLEKGGKDSQSTRIYESKGEETPIDSIIFLPPRHI